MKLFFLLLSFILIVTNTFAQKTEGHVVYSIELSSDDPQMQMAIPMFAGSTLDMYFTKNNSRTELSMGTYVKTTIITDIKKDKMLMLMSSGMIGQLAMQGTISEIKEKAEKGNPNDPQDDNIDSEEELEDFDIEFTDETKVIQGYTCKKAILSNKDGLELIYWYTEEINFSKDGQNYFNEDVPGFPMEFETFNNGIKMKMVVTEFNNSLGKDPSELFDLTIPEGYREMTLEELEKMQQAG